MFRFILSLSLLAFGANAAAAEDAGLKNWFNDPFLQVRSEIADCPAPLGPLLTEAERKAEAHSRVERGTSCWMAGTCAQPNAYMYDAGIGKAIAERFAASDAFRGASLWITVKRRFVWVEGCVSDPAQIRQLETFLLAVPDVERVLVDVMPGTQQKPPYAILPNTPPRNR